MKAVFKAYRFSWFVVFCLAAILAIVLCNLWLLCCGHCVVADFLRIPAIGWVVIVANLAAGLVLLAVKRRGSRKKHDSHVCGVCNVVRRDTWVYCPNCGNQHCP